MVQKLIHDFPFYSVSIGLLRRGRVHQAVVYDPHRDELFCASEGRGAYLNNKRIRVSSQEFLKSCLITTGFPTDEKRMQAFIMKNYKFFRCRSEFSKNWVRSIGLMLRSSWTH